MKTTDSSIGNKNNKWTCLIHLTFIILLVSLCVIIPVVSNTVSAIPYWAILILFLVPFAIYMSLLIISRKLSAATNVPVADMEQDQDEITGLHQHIVVTEEQEDGNGEDDDEEGVPSSIDNTSYNPSTVGIPPSSFLAPTIHQQASIRSSSLEYTPPPPAYQDMMYPPSYRSTNSAKDDNVSVVY
ncbi:Rho GTPase activating protein [Mucor velutinosus]|uniref:Rho GTPase activating protein n=1 Tax=Mucor velutinosus TaxID=708070 RepID=A0AAN7I328_9FUNG|nr:Rho GTPase activating protein [Mucor velutinosus]